ncbi:hypothetical protein BDQ17DRAFT_1315014 [Cyathus striatus]|nr:hypothetical protein BDQ17DRAFT_1315014 [Cyathus striatus]
MDKKNCICPILKVAAKAALLMIEKYTILTSESEVYYIAIVMCPDRKLDWFKERDYHDEQIEEIKGMVVKRWTQNYKLDGNEGPYDGETQKSLGRFVCKAGGSKKKLKPDSIEVYLRESLVEENNVQDMGGYLKYWTFTSKS